MRKNKRRKPMGEINVVPYIDVTLVLLIIFMITTPMLQTGVDVDLPKTPTVEEDKSKEGEGEPKQRIVISIQKDGHYFISVDGATDDPIQPDEINDRVVAELSNKKSPQVFINADRNVDYGSVVTVMASLKNAGVPNVGLMTEPEDGK